VEGVGSFWSRAKEEEGGLVALPASALVQGEGKEAPKGLDVQVVGGRSGTGTGENAGPQLYTPASGSSSTGAGGGERGDQLGALGKPGELQIIWRRPQEQARGGVIPPGVQTAPSSGPSVGLQDSPRAPSGDADGGPNPPSPSAP
jgi:hypothetical protein